MIKTLPITPSFAAWRSAADRLLTLQSALALYKRTMVHVPGEAPPPEEGEIEKVRVLADELFEIARAETVRARGHTDAPSVRG